LGDRPLGSFGDASVFCLYKTLPTPDGGAVVLREGELPIAGVAPSTFGTAREVAAAILASLERSGGTLSRHFARAGKRVGRTLARPQWTPVGTQDFDPADANLLMSDMSKMVLAAQDFDAIVSTRRRNFAHLQSLLSGLAPPVFPDLASGVCPLFYPFVTPRKHELWQRLQAKGVQSVLFWLPRQFAPPAGEFPEVDVLRQTVLELPCHQDMTPDDIERVARTVRTAVRDIGP
jgi:dTDP-4-amino-4,6-dideoxygalactose transaminase